MTDWLTTHGPHPLEYKLPWDIYLQEEHKDIASDIQVGDRVFFYELKGNGWLNINSKDYKTPVGKMGIVHVGFVTGVPYQRSPSEGMSNSYNGYSYWSIGIPTNAGNSHGFVPRKKVVEVLGYSEKYFFKGFASGKGIKIIDNIQAHSLATLFESTKS